MNELFLMVTIVNRDHIGKFLSLYETHGADVSFVTVGIGTAGSEMLDYFGMEKTEKAVALSAVTGNTWSKVKSSLQTRLKIDVPGTGIVFIVPMSSIGGKVPLFFLTENQNFEKGEESSLKDTKHELLVVIANQGYSEMVMDAARAANAGGGTVIHAKGTGMKKAAKFMGMSIVSEKEIVLIVAKTEMKNSIMRSIMDHAGLETKAKGIVFSLPVTSAAGLRLLENEDDSIAEEL